MNPDDIKSALRSQPFQPVLLRLSNGSVYELGHPDAIAVGPRTSAILVGESFQIIANVHINQIEPLAAAS
jgi:hypothetical protein